MQKEQIEKLFGPNGLFASRLPNFEYRQGQVDMTFAIKSALEEQKHLIVEAGTGTGKTLAYLIPAIAFAKQTGQRVIISTGTKNLQEQLMQKDIPLLRRILPKDLQFTAAYMKGRANYACLYRIQKAEAQPILDGMDQLDQFETIREWIGETKTGDRGELTSLPENLSFWNRLNAKSDICIGQKCPEFDACFITKMRTDADQADIVIVNHHLFFADLNVRGNQFGRVLPDYGAVILDEAHLIEDIAADYFGFQVSNFQIDELARDADSLKIDDQAAVRGINRASLQLIGLSDAFWMRFAKARQDGRYPVMADLFREFGRGGEPVPTPLGEAYKALDASLSRLETLVDTFADKLPEAESIVRRTRQTRFDLDFVVSQAESNYVYWLERRGKGMFLKASPIDVSAVLSDKLFEKVPTCVMTSATLANNSRFDFIKKRLGLEPAKTEEMIAPPAFDYENQAMLYIPRAMPDPRSPEYTEVAAGEIVKILKETDGRAFVLATSSASMNALYELVSARVGFPCLLQGEMSRSGLLDKFRRTPHAVLFATAGFWQGIDVKGEQLSCVIIDKLPFAVPTDPVVAARTRAIEEQGGSSFFEYSVPQAIISLKQGVGRLIRSRSDRGIIAILDPRLRTKGYGRDFLASLPRLRITSDTRDFSRILNRSDAAA